MAIHVPIGPEITLGDFNYLAPSVKHSLHRNGEVLTRRDLDGSDGGDVGVVTEMLNMTVHNARLLSGNDRRTIESHGFELSNRPLFDPELDFFDHPTVTHAYYADCVAAVRDVTGASHVFAFDHNIRSAAGKSSKRRITGGQQVQGPAHLVHGDYTLFSAPQRLRDLSRAPGINDTLRSVLIGEESLLEPRIVTRALGVNGRYAIINVWRNISAEPVATHPLALCDAQTVEPLDLVVFEIHYQDRVGENYFAKHSPQHRWYYYPGMTRDEALLIKQWDSAGKMASSGGANGDATGARETCTFSFHSAFHDPCTRPDARERWSIEVRCVVIYD